MSGFTWEFGLFSTFRDAGRTSAKIPCLVLNATPQKKRGKSDAKWWEAQESCSVGTVGAVTLGKGQARFGWPEGGVEPAEESRSPSGPPRVSNHPRASEEPKAR